MPVICMLSAGFVICSSNAISAAYLTWGRGDLTLEQALPGGPRPLKLGLGSHVVSCSVYMQVLAA